jgi:putative chitinase
MIVLPLEAVLQIAPRARASYREAFAHVDVLAAAGLLDSLRRASHFLAQVCHETGGLVVLTESLTYRAERLLQVWPRRFESLAHAQEYAGKPEKLANFVYGSRMGNRDPGDGWRFRGRGLLQVTGRDNYTRIGAALGLDLVGHPYLAASPEHALAVAVAVWQQAGCTPLADKDDLVGIRRRINGGTNGLADCRTWLMQARKVLLARGVTS